MRAVRLDQSVARVPQRQQFRTTNIVATHGQRGAKRVGGELIPEGSNAVSGEVEGIEIGMGQVETDVLHPHEHPPSRVALRQIQALVHGGGLHNQGRGVHQGRSPAPCLDAQHVAIAGQRVQTIERNLGYGQRAIPGQHAASRSLQHLRTGICGLDKGGEHGRTSGQTLTKVRPFLTRMEPGLAHQRRHLRQNGTLRRRLHGRQQHQQPRHQQGKPGGSRQARGLFHQRETAL